MSRQCLIWPVVWAENNNNNVNNNNSKTMFMMRSLWQSYCEGSPSSFDECRTETSGRWPKTKPDDLGCESACTGCQSLHSPSPFIIITQPKSWYSFYRSTDGKGWVDLVSWLHTEMVYPSTDGHPGNTNRVWRSATTLIETNALPLSQTANQVNGRTAPTTFLVAPLL